MSNFVDFTEDGSEYIINNADTKRPLLNYIWNPKILSGVNQFGGGNGAYGDRTASYIDPERKGRAVLIRNGNRYFYIKDEDTGEFWNIGWYPVKKELDEYHCTHGLGYSIIEGKYNDLKTTARVFVNETDPVEIWTIKLKNNAEIPKNIKVYSFIEFSLEGYARYSEYDSYVFSEYDKVHNMIVAHNKAQERPHDWFDGFTASNGNVTGFETSKRAFLGGYGDITAPQTVLKGTCSNSIAACELMVGVLENTYRLMPNQQSSFDVIFGSTNSNEEAVWEHILTAVRYSSEDTGEHGLVLAHDGDWNDSLNGIGVGGKGESVWTSIALYYAL